MDINELNLSSISHISGNIIQISQNESVEDVEISFDSNSKNKLSRLLSTGTVTRENQNLTINSLIAKSEYEDFLTKGQYPFIKTPTGFAMTTNPVSRPRFKAVLQALVTHKNNSSLLYAIEFSIGNFSFDFTNSQKTILDKEIEFENVGMTVYPGSINVKILED